VNQLSDRQSNLMLHQRASRFGSRVVRAGRQWSALGLCLILAATPLAAATARFLILHTNDLHDHLRPGYTGVGGLPYVAGYIKQVRQDRDDVIVLDAGDVTEKGDMVAFATHGEITFEVLKRIGYDGVAIGNHDHNAGMEALRRFEDVLGQGLLCLNLIDDSGVPVFTPSRIVEVGGIKIGLIGLIVPRQEGSLDFAASSHALAREAARLRREVPVVIAVCHESVRACIDWSKAAPAVQIFVSGHSHEALAQPVIVPETGAYIVQAGSYAEWVGRLEVEVDLATETIIEARGELVPMRHDSVPVDAGLLAWILSQEQLNAPNASHFVLNNPAELDYFSLARLAADAWRIASGADIAFCHTYSVIRARLPAGPIDVNAVFRTGGHRGHATVRMALTGDEIAAYINALIQVHREPTEWSGFSVSRRPISGGGELLVPNLHPDYLYQVVMSEKEWEGRFLRLVDHASKRDPANPLALRRFSAEPAGVSFTDAMVGYLAQVIAEGDTPNSRALQLAGQQELQ
jgi:2',3'-cyclic-nucleotide 2'-phosphodiesterase (5'-nucleotidase family)